MKFSVEIVLGKSSQVDKYHVSTTNGNVRSKGLLSEVYVSIPNLKVRFWQLIIAVSVSDDVET